MHPASYYLAQANLAGLRHQTQRDALATAGASVPVVPRTTAAPAAMMDLRTLMMSSLDHCGAQPGASRPPRFEPVHGVVPRMRHGIRRADPAAVWQSARWGLRSACGGV